MSKENEICQTPIFIVGFPRSGTTFLQSLLCTQQGLVSFPETHFFNKATGHFDADHILSIKEVHDIWKILGEKNNLKAEFIESQTKIQVQASQKVIFETLISQLAFLQGVSLKSEDVVWIEKTPSHAIFIDKILTYYPKAKILSIVRNPLRAIDSYHNKLVKYRKPFHDLAAEYKATYDSVESARKQFPQNVLQIKYEDLNLNRVTTMRKVFSFLERTLVVDNLSSYAEEASKLIDGVNEPWKADNTKADSSQLLNSHSLSKKHVLQIQYALENFFVENNYALENKLIYPFYKFYRQFRTT